MNNGAIKWIGIVLFIAGLFWLAKIAAPLMSSFAAPNLEAAARNVLVKYNRDSFNDLILVEESSTRPEKDIKTVLFTTKQGSPRFRVKLLPTHFHRWVELEYESIESSPKPPTIEAK
jgi:hypothetical protein